MSADRVFLDTNVLVYAYDASEPVKRARARRLLAEVEDAVVSTQVLAELYVALTRVGGGVKPPVAPADAEAAVTSLSELTVVVVDAPLVLAAVRRARRSRLSLWDAMIVEASLAANCDRLLTEDLQHGQRFGDLAVENPFRP